jgi:hypothetical protein
MAKRFAHTDDDNVFKNEKIVVKAAKCPASIKLPACTWSFILGYSCNNHEKIPNKNFGER